MAPRVQQHVRERASFVTPTMSEALAATVQHPRSLAAWSAGAEPTADLSA